MPANVIPRFRLPCADSAADIEGIRSLGADSARGVRAGRYSKSLGRLEAEGFTDFFVCAGAPRRRSSAIEGDADSRRRRPSFLAAASRLAAAGCRRRLALRQARTWSWPAAATPRWTPCEWLSGSRASRRSFSLSAEPRDEMPGRRRGSSQRPGRGRSSISASPNAPYLGPEAPARPRAMTAASATPRRRCRPSPPTRTRDRRLRAPRGPVARRPTRPPAALGMTPRADGARSGHTDDLPPAFTWGGRCARTQPHNHRRGGRCAEPDPTALRARGHRASAFILRPLPRPTPTSWRPAAKIAERLDMGPRLRLARGGTLPDLRLRFACRCVEVCPNRANFALPRAPADSSQAIQILHIDALCNECGNCGVFCPYEGEPYRDKPTLFRDGPRWRHRRRSPPRRQPRLRLRQRRPPICTCDRFLAPIAELSFAEWAEWGIPWPRSPERYLSIIPICWGPPMTLFESVRVISFEPPAVSEPMDVASPAPQGEPTRGRSSSGQTGSRRQVSRRQTSHGQPTQPRPGLRPHAPVLGPRPRPHGRHRPLEGLRPAAEASLVAARPRHRPADPRGERARGLRRRGDAPA